jgi:hypothetical protein
MGSRRPGENAPVKKRDENTLSHPRSERQSVKSHDLPGLTHLWDAHIVTCCCNKPKKELAVCLF